MNQYSNNQPIPIEEIIAHFGMKKHVEGGFASLFYEDCGNIKKDSLPPAFDSSRPYFNGIYFLVPQDVKTLFHQLPINELWHFCLGAPLEIYEITPQGQLKRNILGPDIRKGEKLVHIVQNGNWFGTRSLGAYTLVTCTTSPGFRPQDFRESKRRELIALFPHIKELIIEFTYSDENVF